MKNKNITQSCLHDSRPSCLKYTKHGWHSKNDMATKRNGLAHVSRKTEYHSEIHTYGDTHSLQSYTTPPNNLENLQRSPCFRGERKVKKMLMSTAPMKG